jgi:hypothetical protein
VNPRVQCKEFTGAIGLKSKNAADSTDSTDFISLAGDTFVLERPASVHD